MADGDLAVVTRFFLISGETVISLGKAIKATLSSEEIASLAADIRSTQTV